MSATGLASLVKKKRKVENTNSTPKETPTPNEPPIPTAKETPAFDQRSNTEEMEIEAQ